MSTLVSARLSKAEKSPIFRSYYCFDYILSSYRAGTFDQPTDQAAYIFSIFIRPLVFLVLIYLIYILF